MSNKLKVDHVIIRKTT